MKRLSVVLCLLAAVAVAGGRARYGGTLQLCLVARSLNDDALLADSPTAVAPLLLTHTPLCRLAEPSRPSPTTLHLALPDSLAPSVVAQQLLRVQRSNTAAAALLDGVTRVAEGPRSVDLVGAPPDLERALCHPVFSLPVGPFRTKGKVLAAVSELPEGRAYVDAVSVQQVDARVATRLVAQRRTQVVLGQGQADDVPQLFVLALVYSPKLGPHLRAALDATIDRSQLLPLISSAPAAVMPASLPPALGGSGVALPRPTAPAPLRPRREVALWFDLADEDQKRIAEKLQLKLDPLGYQLALNGVPREELRTHVLADHELALVTALLPPSPTGGAAMMLALAGESGRLGALRAASSGPDGDQGARQFMLSAQAELPLWPLATLALGVTTTPDVQHVTRDALGLPRLDDLFLAVPE